MKRVAGLVVLGTVLACGGVGQPPKERVNPYLDDNAERARLRGEYPRAELMLKGRLKLNPNDDVAWLLLGDVNITRGQHYTRKWKENLARAFNAYGSAVTLKPANCVYWARVANVVEMSRIAEGTKLSREQIEGLPLEQGVENCSSAALFSLGLALEATEEEVERQNKLQPKATRWERLNASSPWLKKAFDDVPLDQVEWQPPPEPVPVRGGGLFVVLEPPLTARGQGHGIHRPVSGLETFNASRVSGDRVVFVDRRFPKLLPRKGIVRASACKHTQWKDVGADKVPRGTCTTGAFLRAKSPVWAPERLQIAGPAHYTEASAAVGTVPADKIYWETRVRCQGGKVGRKIEYAATCPVEFDQPNWLTRWLPLDKATGARDQPHADQMINAKGMAVIMGDELSDRMVQGQVGIGMPYGLFRYAFPDLAGCQGRALLAKHRINGENIDFVCTLGDTAYHFTDLQLVYIGSADDVVASAPDP